MIKNKLKKYRAVGVVAGAMMFNIAESLLFAKNGNTFNMKPMSLGEWICDDITDLIYIVGAMMATYDLWKYKPIKTTTYKRVKGKLVEIKVEE